MTKASNMAGKTYTRIRPESAWTSLEKCKDYSNFLQQLEFISITFCHLNFVLKDFEFMLTRLKAPSRMLLLPTVDTTHLTNSQSVLTILHLSEFFFTFL